MSLIKTRTIDRRAPAVCVRVRDQAATVVNQLSAASTWSAADSQQRFTSRVESSVYPSSRPSVVKLSPA